MASGCSFFRGCVDISAMKTLSFHVLKAGSGTWRGALSPNIGKELGRLWNWADWQMVQDMAAKAICRSTARSWSSATFAPSQKTKKNKSAAELTICSPQPPGGKGLFPERGIHCRTCRGLTVFNVRAAEHHLSPAQSQRKTTWAGPKKRASYFQFLWRSMSNAHI